MATCPARYLTACDRDQWPVSGVETLPCNVVNCGTHLFVTVQEERPVLERCSGILLKLMGSGRPRINSSNVQTDHEVASRTALHAVLEHLVRLQWFV